jgi:hypothetical protein
MKKKELNMLIESIKTIMEDINVPINVGDTVLGGKFKNKKIKVKDIGKNEKGDITINDKPLLRVRTLNKEDYKPSKDFYKAIIKISDLYVEADNMMDAYHKSKNGIGPASGSGNKPLTVAKLLDGTLLLLDGHHRVADKIKYLERPTLKNILNLKFEVIIHIENFKDLESIEKVDSDFQYWISFMDWAYATFDKKLKEGINVYYTKIAAYGGGVTERILLNPKPFLHKRAANHFAESQAKKYNIRVDKSHTAAWGVDDVIQIFEEK